MKRIIGALIASSAIVDCAYSAPVVTLTGEYSGPAYTQAPVTVTTTSGQTTLDVNTGSLPFNYQDNKAYGTADTAGNFDLGARVFWQGSATATYSYTDKIINLGTSANAYSLNFLVPTLNLSASESGLYWDASNSLATSYDYQILANGVSVFHSHASTLADGNGNLTLDLSSDLFGLSVLNDFSSSQLYQQISMYMNSPYSGVANLGTLNAGQSIDLSVLVTLTAALNDVAPSDSAGKAFASLGDPLQPSGFGVTSAQVATVPLPPTAALFVSGLLGLGFARRKTNNQALIA